MILKKIIYLSLVLFTSFSLFSQEAKNSETNKQKHTLSGTITDAKSNETLFAVNILIPELKVGIMTNEYGFYSITLPEGKYKIQISSTGFETIEETIDLNKNTKMNFELKTSENVLKEVV